jgi:hypothetical protein
MTSLTHKEVSKLYPSVGRQIEEGRSIVMNSKPNIAEGTPTVIPDSAMKQGLEASYQSIVGAWHSKARMEQSPPEDPALAIIRAFGGKSQKNTADLKQTSDFNAVVSRRWQQT